MKGSSRGKEEYSVEFEEAKRLACALGEETRNAISFMGLNSEGLLCKEGCRAARLKMAL